MDFIERMNTAITETEEVIVKELKEVLDERNIVYEMEVDSSSEVIIKSDHFYAPELRLSYHILFKQRAEGRDNFVNCINTTLDLLEKNVS